MRCPFYQIDAFTGRAFSGNPAAVMLLEEWLPDEVLQAVAAENNLSETAFFRKMAQEAFELRWFTPTTEVPLCGHATLAAGFVVMTEIAPTLEEVSFETLSGRLHVRRRKDMFVLDFPAETPSPSEPPRAIVDALGRDPVEACSGSNHLLVYRHESDVLALEPDMAGLAAALEGNGKGVIATAPRSSGAGDVASRYFAPAHGIPEDPVTGSAHCMIVPYWSRRLGRIAIHAVQVSRRGGELFCEMRGDRVEMGGYAVKFIEGIASIPG